MQHIDIQDESLIRWHFTNIAESRHGATRREAELMFRNNFDFITRKLKGLGERTDVILKLEWLVKELS
jgi:hypothetical protein